MMQFKEQKSIYLQIADRLEENFILRVWRNSERLPAIREIAVQMEVNPNTILRTYMHLQDKGIIFNKRGIGYFAAEDARERVLAERKTLFIEKQLPDLFRTMQTLQIPPEEILTRYEKSIKESEDENK